MDRTRGWPAWRDLLLALGVAGLVLAGVAIAPPSRTALEGLGWVLLLAGPLSLAALRRAPVAVLLVTTACVLGYLLRGYPGVVAAVPVMLALAGAVREGHRLAAAAPMAALGIVVVADLTLVGGMPAREVIEDRFLLAGWLVASAMMGEAARQWGAYVREAQQRATDAEATREQAARLRAREERLRIARELHDSLTHSISVIKVQAGVAVHLARKRGEEVPGALLAVQEASGEAMRELRATLEVLRDPDEEETGPAAAGSGLDRLGDLVERTRAAGLPTTLTVSGQERPLPPAVDRAAFRIIQEALTNTARHAGPASASVRVAYGADILTVQVDDDGAATPDVAAVPGVGLLGMRERVAALGGRLHTGPRPDRGFTVHVELPLRDSAGNGQAAGPASLAGPDGHAGRAGRGGGVTAPAGKEPR